ncbi:MAG: aspartate 1-decarboxylase [Candidatus Omnitrophica bacterium]|nr:aspartate 1-decarboxylase [Candidatus Omnitrophota bacterium]
MMIPMLRTKIAYATITESNLYYEGSISIDRDLMDTVGLIPGQKVEILNINNGQRFETYTIVGERGSGQICLNGPAARLGVIGDQIMILSYVYVDVEEAKSVKQEIVHLDERNKVKS